MRIARLAFASVLALMIAFPASAQQVPATQPAPAGQAARQFRLILLDDSGKAIEGAEVSITGSTHPKEPFVGRTDAQGRCAVEIPAIQAESWCFKITKPGYIPLRTWMSAASAEKLFAGETALRMTRGRTIGGVVKDEAGKPIEGVVFGFYWSNPNRVRQPVTDDYDVTQVRTDANGKWVCDFAPPRLVESEDDFHIFLRHPDYISDHWTGGVIPIPKHRMPNPADLLSRKAVYVMKAGLTLAGKLVDKDSKPVRGALVRLLGSDTQRPANGQRTKADGSFLFRNAETTDRCCVITAKGFAPEMLSVDLTKNAPLDVTLQPGRLIRGKVIDARGMPVEAASLYVSRWRSREGYEVLRFSAKTDKDGRFSWPDAPADGAILGFYKDGYMRHDNVVLLPSDTEQLITLSDPLRITGRVLDAETGKPIDGARIIMGIDWGNGRASWERSEQTAVKDGKYQIEEDGSHLAYVLRAEAEGYRPAVSESIPRDAGRRTVDFRLQKAKPIAGKLIGPDGKPVAGVEVHVATAGERAYLRNGTDFLDRRYRPKVTTAADGSFSLPPDDRVFTIVVATDAGYAEASSANVEKTGQVRLAPWGRIEGVVMQGAKPLPNASVGASPIGFSDATMVYHELRVSADAQGRFTIPRVPPGQFQVHRVMTTGSIGIYICHQNVTVEGGKTVTVTLGGNGRTVVARLDQPVPAGLQTGGGPSVSIIDAASAALGEQMFHLHPANWDKMDAAQQAKWAEQWRRSEEGKAFTKLSEEVQKKARYHFGVLHPDGKIEAFNIPPGQYVLMVSIGSVVNGTYASAGTAKKTFEVPDLKPGDLDSPLDLGVLTVETAVVMPADIAVGAQGQSAATTDQKTPASPTASQALLNQPLKLDLDAGLAGKKLLIVAASIEQRPSRRALDMLATQAKAIAKQGIAIVLVHAAVTDEAQVRQWLKDHKLEVAQLICSKDQADAAKLMSACGAESLPAMLTTDGKHVVTAVDVQPDKLGLPGAPDKTPATVPQSTTSPAPAAARPAFDPLVGLDRTILAYNRGLDATERGAR